MKLAVTVLLMGALVALAGCAGTRATSSPGPSDGPASSPDASMPDELGRAEELYREALSHYVCDDWDAAEATLGDALDALGRIDVGRAVPDTRSLHASLESRIRYFLSVIDGEPDHVDDVAAEPAQPTTDRPDTVALEAPVAVSPVRRDRPTIEVVRNRRVEKWIDYFEGKGRKEMQRWLGRAPRYRPMIEEILDEYGLPSELFFLAMIESGLNPAAYSRAHAAGMWQFISSRARIYDLRVDWWIDERRDPEKATHAAAQYLRDLHEMFGSWELALAGYNSGEGRVQRALRRRSTCKDYWCLDLPRETENFVPKFMAAVIIGSDPEAYGFTTSSRAKPFVYDTISISDAVDLTVLAEASGVGFDEIKLLNPALRRWCTPPSGGGCDIRVPSGTARRCLEHVASIPEEDRVTWRRHRISRGETLSEIARAYGTSISAIVAFNDIRNPHSIRSGQYLVIPVGPDDGDRYASGVLTYTVRRGDTVTSIARRHGKNPRDVLRWNGLGWNSKIYPGDTLKIHNL